MQSGSDDHLKQLTQQLAALMTENNHSLATAESCTGGWLAKCCTDLPGSSAWFDRGFVTYSNEAKHTDLHVPNNILATFGAVSENTAIAMAEGALINSPASLSVAITGVAGPDGGTASKPVGAVCFAFTAKNKQTTSLTQHFEGNREMVRRQALVTALQGIIKNARDAVNSMG